MSQSTINFVFMCWQNSKLLKPGYLTKNLGLLARLLGDHSKTALKGGEGVLGGPEIVNFHQL